MANKTETKNIITSLKDKLLSKLRIADRVVIILCFAGTVVSLSLFWADMFTTVRNKNAAPLGTINKKYNTAQRRLADRVLWDRLRRKSPIYNGDIIRTADLSGATILFPGGREIDLAENTLIRIRMRDGSTEIDLSGGEVNLGAGTANDTIILSMGDQKVEAGSDAVISASSGKKGKTVQVASGKAVFATTGSGQKQKQTQKQTISAGTSISLENGASPTGPSAVVTKPLPNARFLIQGNEPLLVAFTWNRVNLSATEPLRLEIAKNRIFSSTKKTIPVVGSNATAELTPGLWYWQIKQESGDVLLASGRLTVLDTPAPSLISPVRGYTYQYRLKPPSVRFQWLAIDDADQYQVEVANNSGFNTPQIKVKTKGTTVDSSALTEGTWYWRVTPIFSGAYQGKVLSSSASFQIEHNTTVNTPTLIGPEAGAAVNISTDKGVYFSWKNEYEAASYTIKIAKDRNMQNPVIQEKIKQNVYVYRQKNKVLDIGNYYWAVSLTDIAGNESPLSAVQPFSAIMGDPARRPLFPPNNYVIAEDLLPEIRFAWKSDFNSNARFQVSKTSAFTALVIDEKVLGESFRGKPLPPGNYYWRVVGVDTSQQANVQQFTVASPLQAPVADAPPPGSQVVLKGDGEPMVLRWRSVNRAEQYIVRVYTGDRRTNQPVLEQTVGATILRIPANKFSTGSYSWTVQAYANETSNATRLSGLTGEQQFSVRKLYLLKLDSPETNSEIKGPVVLRWSTAETVGNSRLVISRNSNPARAPVLEIINPARTITLNDLTEGQYYWNIIAVTSDGFDISAATPRRFLLLPNLLPEPAGLSPIADMVIGPEALRANKNIVFSCDPVEGATGYVFTVFKKTETGAGRQQLIQTTLQTEPSWTLEDLQSLGEGDFIWQVEAVSQNEGEAKLGRGNIVENSFRMEIPRPNQVQILEAGVMYGK